MKLIALQCDRPGFHALHFRPDGISVIVGDAGGGEGSSNGVGKTLALRLVHHCLGGSVLELLKKSLGDWTFSLTFELPDGMHRIDRAGNGKSIYLDGSRISERGLCTWLDSHGPFVLDPHVRWISFRSLYGRFARKEREDRVDPVRLKKEQDYQALIRTLYLLGMDVTLAQRKAERRDRVKRIENTKKLLKQSDPRLQDLLRQGVPASAQSESLKDDIRRLRQSLETMQIAEDYETIRREADEATARLRDIEGELARIAFHLEGIEKLLDQRPDISRAELLGFYEGLQHWFRPEALKHFADVESFHQSLAERRRQRLGQDRRKLLDRQRELEEQKRSVSRERDAKLKYLAEKHAIDEYRAVAQRLAKAEEDLQRLESYEETARIWEEELLALNAEQSHEDQEALNLVASKPLARADERFRAIVRRLYPQEAAGIALENNLGRNRLRYNLSVSIQGEDSDGINAARVMAFDWIVFWHGANHTMQHLWHDNGLFDHIDPHQRAAWLEMAFAELEGSGRQYIISINTENYESTKSCLPRDLAERLEDSVITRLRGDDPRHKLLGVLV